MDAKAEKLALFRYGLIAPLSAGNPAARRTHPPRPGDCRPPLRHPRFQTHFGFRRYVAGLVAPLPHRRLRCPGPQTAPGPRPIARPHPATRRPHRTPQTRKPHRTGATLLRELALSSGQNDPGVSASTLYRFLKQHGLTERQLLAPPAHKKFEAQLSNQIWQADMLFGPYVQRPGGGKMQAFLHATLDDASRLIPHAQFYPSQGLDACLDCLRQAIAARGVPVRLYIDNAKIYRSQQLARIAASLGISIVHTPPYQPEGRGKIERYFRTVRDQFLTNLDPKQSLSLEQLNDRLSTWIENAYHRSEHSALALHSAAALAARYRARPPTPAGHRSAPPLLLSPGSPGAPRLHFPAAQPYLRSPAASRAAKPSRSVSILSTPPKWRSISRENRKAQRASSIPSSTPACLP